MAAHDKRLDEQFAESDLDETLTDHSPDADQVVSSMPQISSTPHAVNPSPHAVNSSQTANPPAPVAPRIIPSAFGGSPYQQMGAVPGNQALGNMPIDRDLQHFEPSSAGKKYVAYTIKLPSDQLAALQSIWLELKRLYGAHSPDKSGMIQQAISDWLRRWDGPERSQLLQDLLDIRQDTRRRQYRK